MIELKKVKRILEELIELLKKLVIKAFWDEIRILKLWEVDQRPFKNLRKYKNQLILYFN
jgi:hypothetical protein